VLWYGLVLDSAHGVRYIATTLVFGADVAILTAEIQEESPTICCVRMPSGSEITETGRHTSSDFTTCSLKHHGLSVAPSNSGNLESRVPSHIELYEGADKSLVL
jgi:hypothetical protein